jgi:large repetitive protein
MRVRRLKTAVMAGVLMSAGLAVAAPASVDAAAPAAPSLFPADGATVTATTPTVTATYPAPYRSDGSASLSVLDTSTGTPMPCTDALRQVSGDEKLRCPLSPLHAGDSYTATATAIDRTTGQSQTTTWSFTADLPSATDETPPTTSAASSPHISYDRPLDASSTVELFGESGQVRTAVSGSGSVTGHDATFTPTATMADGEYALVVHAASDGDAASYTDSVDEFFVGTPPTAPGKAPTITSVITGSSSAPQMIPGFVTLSGTGRSGATLFVQLYSPTSPTTSEVLTIIVPSCATPMCTWNRTVGTNKAVAAASTHAIRVFSATGSVSSTPDYLYQPIVTTPPSVTNVDVPDVTSANVSAVPVTVTLPSGDVGARVGFRTVTGPGTSQNGPTLDVAAAAGQVTTVVDLSALGDGQLVVSASPFDSYGNLGSSVSAVSTKEAISLAPSRYNFSDTQVAAQPFLEVDFNEEIRSDSTLAITKADGEPVTGDVALGNDSVRFDAIGTSTKLASGSTVTVTLHAYASTCPADQTTTCDDQFSRTWTETVDTTPPPAPVNVRCSPGVVDPTSGLLTVTGESTSGDRLIVGAGPAKGGDEVARNTEPLGQSNGGLTSWSITLNLRGGPVDNYQVFAFDIDPAGNQSPSSHRLYCGLGTPTRLTLTGLPKSHIVPVLKKVVIRGRLTSAGPSPVPLGGRTVQIRQFRTPHFDAGVDYPPTKTVRTDSSGNWHATVRLLDSEYLQAWFPGDSTHVPVSSWTGRRVRTTVRLPLSVRKPAAGSTSGHATPLVISGHERARLAGGWALFDEPVSVLLTRAGHRRAIRAHTRPHDGNWSLRLPVRRGHWTLTVTAAPKPGKHANDFAARQIRVKFRRR